VPLSGLSVGACRRPGGRVGDPVSGSVSQKLYIYGVDHPDKCLPPVLVCPLDWGLGHATRCVPLIRIFLDRGMKVVVAAGGDALEFLRKAFPSGGPPSSPAVRFLSLPGKAVRYPGGGGSLSMTWSLMRQLPGLLYSVRSEHRRLQDLVRETGAGWVVSDNRYGLFTKRVPCVFMGHQLNLRPPRGMAWAGGLMNRVNHWLIGRFSACWVPDFPGTCNLSGTLSHGGRLAGRVRYLGPLSRFRDLAVQPTDNPLPEDFPPDFLLLLLSGPEPQRSLFEQLLVEQLAGLSFSAVMVRGLVGSGAGQDRSYMPDHLPGNCRLAVFDHLPDRPLAWLLKESGVVVCRPGYSSLMDLSVFGKKALLVPTPGQTEQEYLGQRLQAAGLAACLSQEGLPLESGVDKARSGSGIPRMEVSDDLLHAAVDELLEMGGQAGAGGQ